MPPFDSKYFQNEEEREEHSRYYTEMYLSKKAQAVETPKPVTVSREETDFAQMEYIFGSKTKKANGAAAMKLFKTDRPRYDFLRTLAVKNKRLAA